MLNKLVSFCREQMLITPGDRIVCAVSGGADSIALLWAMYLLRDKLGITLECAHFNHQLRGEESDRDAAFVRQFCTDYHIPFHYGTEAVAAGDKGLEAAARDARYRFLRGLPGKVATAHTADDNAETVLMHLIRGTGLKGLGGIAPQNGNIIRPMLTVTREDVLAFIEEYALSYVEDGTNREDAFLRNRLRHHVMPLLKAENPKLSQSLSRTALRLRQDEDYLQNKTELTADFDSLRQMHPAVRARAIAAFLEQNGVAEPGTQQIAAVEALLYTDRPSASVQLPGNVVIGRNYGILQVVDTTEAPADICLTCPGSVCFGDYRITAIPANAALNTKYHFTVSPDGEMVVRSRKTGDEISFAFGKKTLKKLFIDQKIPAQQRPFVPVIADCKGVLGVAGFGANMQRTAAGTLVEIKIEQLTERNMEI